MRNVLWVSFSVDVLSVDENGVLELPTISCLDIFEP